MQVDQVGCVFGGMPGHALLCHLRSSVARVQPAAHPSRSGRQRDVRTAKGRHENCMKRGQWGKEETKTHKYGLTKRMFIEFAPFSNLRYKRHVVHPLSIFQFFCRLNDSLSYTSPIIPLHARVARFFLANATMLISHNALRRVAV